MNQLVPYTETQVATLLSDRTVSSPLWHAMRLCADPHPDIGRPNHFPALVQREAAIMADHLADACQPAGDRFVAEWVKVIVYGISAGAKPSEHEAAARLAGIVLALQDLPLGAFTEEVKRSILRTCRFAPMPADLYEILAPRAHALTERRDLLRYIAGCEAERPHPPSANVVPLRRLPEPQEPARTVEEQIAAMKGA